MTGYSLEEGYNGWARRLEPGELLEMAKRVDLAAVKAKALEYSKGEHERLIREIVKHYETLPSEDYALVVFKDEEGRERLYSCASGSGKYRDAKEFVRRAFSLLLLDEVFKSGAVASLTVS